MAKAAVKKSGDKQLIAEAKALLKQSVKDERKYGWLREGCELWGDCKSTRKVRKMILIQALAPFWAKHFGVSQERFEQWRDHYKVDLRAAEMQLGPRQCTFITKSGRQCSKSADGMGFPHEFFKGYTDCCTRHKRKLTKAEDIEQTMIDYQVSRADAEKIQKMPFDKQMALLFARIRDNSAIVG